MATHSPQPSAASVTARTNSTSRRVSVPNDVRKGATRGMSMRRSSIPSSFIRGACFLSLVHDVSPVAVKAHYNATRAHSLAEGLANRDSPRDAEFLVVRSNRLDVFRGCNEKHLGIGRARRGEPIRCRQQSIPGFLERYVSRAPAYCSQIPLDQEPVALTVTIDLVTH